MVSKLLVIDNYDSFTYNLVQMFRCYDLSIKVHRSDQITLEQARAFQTDYLLISPGPRDPAHAGISIAFIRAFYRETPILGVCLGMQCINEAFGGETVRAALPVHGKTSLVSHRNESVFKGIASPFRAARYHSLTTYVDECSGLKVSAMSDDGVVMGLYHPEYPLHGVQFHPESFLTEHGFALIERFLGLGPLKNPKQINPVRETFMFSPPASEVPASQPCHV
ncbi:MAG: aminodeoxychorismate/anthranilate synthase component II [Deltaproteobacteria bacterium]|nr:aminodeoxychorismate/anthranilate synthase component II [Deltaproteobacteria bacterium]